MTYINPYATSTNYLYSTETIQNQQQNWAYNDLSFNADYSYQQKVEDVKANSYTADLTNQVNVLLDLINNDRMDNFIDQWNIFEGLIKNNKIYGAAIDANDSRAVTAQAIQIFTDCTGFDPSVYLQSSRSAFTNAFIKGVTGSLFGETNTNRDAYHHITYSEKTKSEQAEEVAGSALGGATLGALVPLIGAGIVKLCGGKVSSGGLKWSTIGQALLGGIAGGVIQGVNQSGKREEENQRLSNVNKNSYSL